MRHKQTVFEKVIWQAEKLFFDEQYRKGLETGWTHASKLKTQFVEGEFLAYRFQCMYCNDTVCFGNFNSSRTAG